MVINSSDSNSYLTFRLGSELYGSGVANIISILEMTKVTRVPKAPDYMKGVINLRGSVLPVMDLRIKFGMEDTEYTTNTCILVLEVFVKNESIRMGAIVDSVQEVIDILPDAINPPPSIGTDFNSEFITGMAQNDAGEFIMILDVSKIFADESMIDLRN